MSPVQTLTKIIEVRAHDNAPVMTVVFADGAWGDHDLHYLMERGGGMIDPLREPAFFRRVFLEAGAPTWPNGFDLAPEAIRRRLKAQGKLHAPAA